MVVAWATSSTDANLPTMVKHLLPVKPRATLSTCPRRPWRRLLPRRSECSSACTMDLLCAKSVFNTNAAVRAISFVSSHRTVGYGGTAIWIKEPVTRAMLLPAGVVRQLIPPPTNQGSASRIATKRISDYRMLGFITWIN